MSKKCEITRCMDCPHMDNQYYDYMRTCALLKKILDEEMCDIYTEIYEECPLKDWKDGK